MMKLKSIMSTIASTVICALYLCATVGFDVHHDGHDHRLYVVSLLEGISCEEVHPEDLCECYRHDRHDCHDHQSSHDHEHSGPHDDCTDDIHQIRITGTDFHFNIDLTPLSCEVPGLMDEWRSFMTPGHFYAIQEKIIPPDNILITDCILRV